MNLDVVRERAEEVLHARGLHDWTVRVVDNPSTFSAIVELETTLGGKTYRAAGCLSRMSLETAKVDVVEHMIRGLHAKLLVGLGQANGFSDPGAAMEAETVGDALSSMTLRPLPVPDGVSWFRVKPWSSEATWPVKSLDWQLPTLALGEWSAKCERKRLMGIMLSPNGGESSLETEVRIGPLGGVLILEIGWESDGPDLSRLMDLRPNLPLDFLLVTVSYSPTLTNHRTVGKLQFVDWSWPGKSKGGPIEDRVIARCEVSSLEERRAVS